MTETGIDWNRYDHGPGSEEWKRKRAREVAESVHKTEARLQALGVVAEAATAYREKFRGALPYQLPIGEELRRLIDAVDGLGAKP